MLLEDRKKNFINWSTDKRFSGEFVGCQEVSVRGELKKMAVFKRLGVTYYAGNYQIIHVLEANMDKNIVGEVISIELKGLIDTAEGNQMMDFKIETVESVEGTGKRVREDKRVEETDVPF